VIQALQADSTLPFDLEKLKDLIHQELGSWSRHGKWIMEMELRAGLIDLAQEGVAE